MGEPAKKAEYGRVGFIDEYRGLFVIAMVAYHAMYSAVHIFGADWPFFGSVYMRFAQRLIVASFIAVSGISSRYSKSNIRRGLAALGFAGLVTAATVLFVPSQAIYFGALHFLGAAMVLFGLLRRALDALPAFAGLVLMLLLAAFAWDVPRRAVGLFGLSAGLPAWLYSSPYLFPLGLPGPGFHSADYVPIVPWLFVFFAGGYVGVFFQRGLMPKAMYRVHFPALAAVGRRALAVYLLHQPVIYGLFWVVFIVL